MNLGLPQLPQWVMKLFFAFGCIGVGAVWFGACVGVAYLIRHLHWIP